MQTQTAPPPGDRGTALRPASGWDLIAWALLIVRFTLGWIFWGGGSRRFIYAPQKLNPHAASWMANKLQTAIPGALLGTGSMLAYLLHHFTLLYGALIFFSAVELVFGVFLIVGFMTRLSALVTIGLSIALMLLFGWQGATCIDEWTMASATLAMGLALFLGGSTAGSVDGWLLRRSPALERKTWFQWLGSGAWPEARLKRWSLIGTIVAGLFIVLTYNYYRGSVLTPFHGGPTSPSRHALTLSRGRLLKNGAVSFRVAVMAGTAAEPSHIVRIRLYAPDGRAVERWNAITLSHLSPDRIHNGFAYNRFVPGFVGLVARVGAEATVTLPPRRSRLVLVPGRYRLDVRTVSGARYHLPVSMP
jgi:thiosulfate dehydrogenase [quinone] large subunit